MSNLPLGRGVHSVCNKDCNFELFFLFSLYRQEASILSVQKIRYSMDRHDKALYVLVLAEVELYDAPALPATCIS